MKNIFLFSASKCEEKHDCRGKKDVAIEETNSDNTKQTESSKLDFQLFDLDTVFAN